MKQAKIKYLFTLIILIPFLFVGCLKDKGPGTENYSHSPALVGFQYTGFSFTPVVASILGTPQDSLAIEVTLSVASLTLSSPVTVSITADQGTLDAYNADSTQSSFPTKYILLPSSEFTIPNGGAITISPGQQMVTFAVHFAGDKIDFTKSNALALKITNATGAIVASNLNTYVILIKLKSIYEGNYIGSGARIRYAGATVASGVVATSTVSGIIPFGTVGLKEIDGQLGDAGSGYTMALVIHDDQPAPYPVDVVPDPLSASGGTPSGINAGTSAASKSTYNPANKTFDLHFSYKNGSGNLREVNEQLVYQP